MRLGPTTTHGWPSISPALERLSRNSYMLRSYLLHHADIEQFGAWVIKSLRKTHTRTGIRIYKR